MGSLNTRHAFDPLDLTIIDRVYEVACAHIEARNLCDPQKCAEEEDYVRQWLFARALASSTSEAPRSGKR